MIPGLVITVSGKFQPNPGRMTKGTDPLGMKVWITLGLAKTAEVLAEGGGNAQGSRRR